MNVAILLEANFSKLIEGFVDGGTEHQSLWDWTFLWDLFQLVVETFIFEQLISLIIDNHLDSAQFQICLLKKLH